MRRVKVLLSLLVFSFFFFFRPVLSFHPRGYFLMFFVVLFLLWIIDGLMDGKSQCHVMAMNDYFYVLIVPRSLFYLSIY